MPRARAWAGIVTRGGRTRELPTCGEICTATTKDRRDEALCQTDSTSSDQPRIVNHIGYFTQLGYLLVVKLCSGYRTIITLDILYIYIVNLRPGYRAHIDYLLVNLVVDICSLNLCGDSGY